MIGASSWITTPSANSRSSTPPRARSTRHPLGLGELRRRGEQRGLADPGRSLDQHVPAGAGRGAAEHDADPRRIGLALQQGGCVFTAVVPAKPIPPKPAVGPRSEARPAGRTVGAEPSRSAVIVFNPESVMVVARTLAGDGRAESSHDQGTAQAPRGGHGAAGRSGGEAFERLVLVATRRGGDSATAAPTRASAARASIRRSMSRGVVPSPTLARTAPGSAGRRPARSSARSRASSAPETPSSRVISGCAQKHP